LEILGIQPGHNMEIFPIAFTREQVRELEEAAEEEIQW
jgi:hypothetical protein